MCFYGTIEDMEEVQESLNLMYFDILDLKHIILDFKKRWRGYCGLFKTESGCRSDRMSWGVNGRSCG